MLQPTRYVLLLWCGLLSAALISVLAAGVATVQAAPPDQEAPPVYLPLVKRMPTGSGGTATPVPATPPPASPTPGTPTPSPTPVPTEQPPAEGAFFLDSEVKNNSADVELDRRGGLHAAYAYFVPTVDHPRAVYTFCTAGAATCTDPAAWQSVALSDAVREVQLELTADGHPRLLIVSEAQPSGGLDHAYAECNDACGEAASWTITSVVTSYNAGDILDQDAPQRSFALDPQDRPAFLYNDRNYQYAEPDKYGTYYAVCYESCTESGNWQTETQVSITYWGSYRYDYEVMRYPSLAFSADGKAHFVARVFALNRDGSDAPDGLYYYSCDAECHIAWNWNRIYLLPTGEGTTPYPSWDLALDDVGRPRIALFTGDSLEPEEFNHRLLYLFCRDGCLDGENWFFNAVLAEPGDGRDAALEVNGQGRPRIAWVSATGDVGYSWCDDNCESESDAVWQTSLVESEATLRGANPQAIPTHCDTDTWHSLAPALALDAEGAPYIVFDVAVDARCAYDETPADPSDPLSYRFEPIWRGVHLNFFPQP